MGRMGVAGAAVALLAVLGYVSGAFADDGLADVPEDAQVDARRALADARNILTNPIDRALTLRVSVESTAADPACRDSLVGTTGHRVGVRFRTLFGLPFRGATVCGRNVDGTA